MNFINFCQNMNMRLLSRIGAVIAAGILICALGVPFAGSMSGITMIAAILGFCAILRETRAYEPADLPNPGIRADINNDFKKTRKLAFFWTLAGCLAWLMAWSGSTASNFITRATSSFSLALSIYVMIYMAVNMAAVKKLRNDVSARLSEEKRNAQKSH